MSNEAFAVATVDKNLSVSHGTDENVYVEFDTMPELQAFESEKSGKPIFKDIEIIRIFTPGKQQPLIRKVIDRDMPMQPADTNRWPRAYKAFKDKVTLAPEGFALEQWGVITKSDALNLKSYNIHTVEQLAAAPDTALDYIPGGRGMRNKAQAFLKDAGGGKEVIRQAARITELEEQLKEISGQYAEIKKLLDAKNSNKKTGE